VLLGSGSAIPADCLVNDGRIEVDQSALTGESMPVTMYKGDSAKMGSTVTRGEVEATVQVCVALRWFEVSQVHLSMCHLAVLLHMIGCKGGGVF
jgi:H+-transporting ATPase